MCTPCKKLSELWIIDPSTASFLTAQTSLRMCVMYDVRNTTQSQLSKYKSISTSALTLKNANIYITWAPQSEQLYMYLVLKHQQVEAAAEEAPEGIKSRKFNSAKLLSLMIINYGITPQAHRRIHFDVYSRLRLTGHFSESRFFQSHIWLLMVGGQFHL